MLGALGQNLQPACGRQLVEEPTVQIQAGSLEAGAGIVSTQPLLDMAGRITRRRAVQRRGDLEIELCPHHPGRPGSLVREPGERGLHRRELATQPVQLVALAAGKAGEGGGMTRRDIAHDGSPGPDRMAASRSKGFVSPAFSRTS